MLMFGTSKVQVIKQKYLFAQLTGGAKSMSTELDDILSNIDQAIINARNMSREERRQLVEMYFSLE